MKLDQGKQPVSISGLRKVLLYRSNLYLLLQTEIPQFILEAGMASYNTGAVAVTQPRRVAAVNLAKRVAEETLTTLGKRVILSNTGRSDVHMCTNMIVYTLRIGWIYCTL